MIILSLLCKYVFGNPIDWLTTFICGIVELMIIFVVVGEIINHIEKKKEEKLQQRATLNKVNLAKAKMKMAKAECQQRTPYNSIAKPDYTGCANHSSKTSQAIGCEMYNRLLAETENRYPKGGITWSLWNDVHGVKSVNPRQH